MKKITSAKLSAYFSSAVSFLLLHNSEAQVVYTDVDPDIILDENLETAGIDIDNNGTFDFAFANYSFTYYNSLWFSYRLRQDILGGPYIPENNIAGNSVHFSTGSGGFIWTFPYALASGELIDNYLQWHSAGQQILAIRTYYQNGELYNTCNQCYWYNGDIPETLDHYIGVKFLDTDNQTHYGWIRCDVLDEGRTLIIKDYAYEVEPEYPIVAGDTIEYVDIQSQENNFSPTVYSFGNTVYINFREIIDYKVSIYDLDGKEIFTEALHDMYYTKVLNVSKGIYIVNVQSNVSSFSKTVFVQ